MSLRFLYIDVINVMFSFVRAFRVAIALHLRFELLPAINSVIASRFYKGLKLIFIIFCFHWIRVCIEKHGHSFLLSCLNVTILSFRRLRDNFFNFEVHHREILGADDWFA